MKNLYKNIIIAVIIFLAISVVFSLYSASSNKPKNIDTTTLLAQIDAEQINSIMVKDTEIDITLKNGQAETAQKKPMWAWTSCLKITMSIPIS